MTVEVRFMSPEDWEGGSSAFMRPVGKTELIETLRGEQGAFKQRAAKRFFNKKGDLFVVDKRPINDPNERDGFRLDEGAEVEFILKGSKLGHMPIGTRIELWEGKSVELSLRGEVIAEIEHIPAIRQG